MGAAVWATGLPRDGTGRFRAGADPGPSPFPRLEVLDSRAPGYARISFTTRPSSVGPISRWSSPWYR